MPCRQSISHLTAEKCYVTFNSSIKGLKFYHIDSNIDVDLFKIKGLKCYHIDSNIDVDLFKITSTVLSTSHSKKKNVNLHF